MQKHITIVLLLAACGTPMVAPANDSSVTDTANVDGALPGISSCTVGAAFTLYQSPDSNVDMAHVVRVGSRLFMVWIDIPPSLDRHEIFLLPLDADGHAVGTPVSVDRGVAAKQLDVAVQGEAIYVAFIDERQVFVRKIDVGSAAVSVGPRVSVESPPATGLGFNNLHLVADSQGFTVFFLVENMHDDIFVATKIVRLDPMLSRTSAREWTARRAIELAMHQGELYAITSAPLVTAFQLTRVGTDAATDVSRDLHSLQNGSVQRSPRGLVSSFATLEYSFVDTPATGSASILLSELRADAPTIDPRRISATDTITDFAPWGLLRLRPDALLQLGSIESNIDSRLHLAVQSGSQVLFNQAISEASQNAKIWQDTIALDDQRTLMVYRQFLVGPQPLMAHVLTCM